jgi:hypothetical protein
LSAQLDIHRQAAKERVIFLGFEDGKVKAATAVAQPEKLVGIAVVGID